jgi:transposase-like protein
MPRSKKQSSEAAVRDIRRKTRRRFSAEDKIRIVLDGMRGASRDSMCDVGAFEVQP